MSAAGDTKMGKQPYNAMSGGGSDGGVEDSSLLSNNGSGSVVSSTPLEVLAAAKIHRKNNKTTRVAPLLLLRAIPEAVMCQLVLAGWEESSGAGQGY